MRYVDAIFARWPWYRRWRGGVWYYRYLDYPRCRYVWSRQSTKPSMARGDTLIEDYTP